MEKHIKTILLMLAIGTFTYLLPFSTKKLLLAFNIAGTEISNDFTKIFLFGIDSVAFLAIASLIYFFIKKQEVKLNLTTAEYFLLAFLVWTGISYLATSNQTILGLQTFSRLIFATILLIAVSRFNYKKTFNAISVGLIITGIFQSIFAIEQFIMQKSLGLSILGESPLQVGLEGVSTFTFFGEKILRSYGTLPHPNILAFFLFITLIFTYYFYENLKGTNYKYIEKFLKYIKISTAIISVGLLLTFSRFFIVLTILVFLYIFLEKRLFYKFNIKKIVSISIVGILAIFLIFSIRPPANDQSLKLRNTYNSVAIEQIKKHPFFGVGIGQQVLLSGDEIKLKTGNEYQAWMHQPAHNAFLLIASETGIIGLIIFIAFIIKIFIDLLKIKNKNLMVVFVAIVLAMNVDHMFLTNPSILYLMFIIFGVVLNERVGDK